MAPYIRQMRFSHWIKNGVCIGGLLFSQKYLEIQYYLPVLLTFISFGFAASAVYIFNDIIDRDLDKCHPIKRSRPIASGQLSLIQAFLQNTLLVTTSLALAFSIDKSVFNCIVAYLILNIIYSLKLKQIVIIDVVCIASGFVLRLLAGIFAIKSQPTLWILSCTFFLMLFLGFCKRYSEFIRFKKKDPKISRPSLEKYNLRVINGLLITTLISTLILYVIFTLFSSKSMMLVMTAPLVFWGLIYYYKITRNTHASEYPENQFLRNRKLQWIIALWLILFLGIDFLY